MEKFHEHDCTSCVYLGSEEIEFTDFTEKLDFYYCPDEAGIPHTIVARYGIDGDYYSGLGFAFSMIPLNVGFKLMDAHIRKHHPELVELYEARMHFEFQMRGKNGGDQQWFEYHGMPERRFRPDFLTKDIATEVPESRLEEYYKAVDKEDVYWIKQ
jgi:hypothetical protein